MSLCLLGFNDVVAEATIGMAESKTSLMDPKFWIRDFTLTRDGFCYTLNCSLKVGSDYETHAVAIYAKDNTSHQVIYVHDPDFFILNGNPRATSKTSTKAMANTFQYQTISLVEHSLLNHEKVPCEPRRDYSFRECVRKSFVEKVKCRLPWPELISAENGVPVCQHLDQYIHFEKLYAEINVVSTNSIENITKCLRPCHYKEYRMEDIPGTISKKPEKFSSAFVFWFVSTEVNVEDQAFVYPWQSLACYIFKECTLRHDFSHRWLNLEAPWGFLLDFPSPPFGTTLPTPFWSSNNFAREYLQEAKISTLS